MIRIIKINNFKSLADFRLPPTQKLNKFTCLIGLNGSGKSSLLQAFDFLGQLADGHIEDWLKRREWKKSELTSRLLNKQRILFSILFEFKDLGPVSWLGAYNANLQRCTHEQIRVFDQNRPETNFILQCLSIEDGKILVKDLKGETLRYDLKGLSYQGSTLSLLRPEGLHPAIAAVKDFVRQLKSLDMLTPQAMRKRAKDGMDIGYGGERLSAFLHSLTIRQKHTLLQQLQQFYPGVIAVETSALRAGWKELAVQEAWQDAYSRSLETTARHMNDGLLRILAILAQTLPAEQLLKGTGSKFHQVPQCLLFDEIENGVNPALVPALVNHLVEAPQQIIVTTHSPMILNFLSDEIAKESVILLYRDQQGSTHSVRFFDLPSTRKRLEFMGPGEVFVDVDLQEMAEEAAALAPAGNEGTAELTA